MELERRKNLYPHKFYEPANDKVLEFHKSGATTRALFGANRSSKTESTMMEAVWRTLGEHPYQDVPPAPTYGRIVVVDYNQLEKVVNEKLSRMFPKDAFKMGKWEKSYNDRTHILKLNNGSHIDFMTHEQPVASFEGSSRDFTVFDEEPPEDIYTSCIMRHVDRNGKSMFGLTPLKGLTYLYDKIYLRSFTDPAIDCWTLSIYENRFLNQAAIDEIENLVQDDVDRQIRLYGKFMSRSGLVFSNFDPQVHVYTPNDALYERWDGYYPPASWIHYVGIDPGWGHPTGVVWVAVDPTTLDRYVYMEHKEQYLTPREHVEYIKATNRIVGITNPIYVIDSQAKAAEHSSGSNVWNEYRKYGVIARLGSKKLIDGNMKLNYLMKVEGSSFSPIKRSKLHISSECEKLIGEIGRYQRAPETAMSDRERFIDKDNDLIAALRYANWEIDKITYDEMEQYIEENRVLHRKQPLRFRKGSPHTGY